jgi:beta-glucosidase
MADPVGEPVGWPEGFLWGTGASSTQTEGAAPASDWWAWERAGQAPPSGDGNGFATRYREDFALLAGLGLTHHRLSLEWARLEPEEGVHDLGTVAHYRDVLSAAREAGIVPWVTLHHFTLPRWFADAGGFLHEANRTGPWRRHVDFVARTFGDLVGGWKPVNEINYYAGAAYQGRGWPPGHRDEAEWAACTEQIHLAAAEASVVLRSTGAPTASIFGMLPVVALDDEPATVAMTERLTRIHRDIGIGLFRDGVLAVPGRRPVERPDLTGAFDLYGFSYYASLGVRAGRVGSHPEDGPVSPLGYTISSAGLARGLAELVELLPSTPLLVAEYGVGTDDDTERATYLAEGLDVIRRALGNGADIRGFFHWTAVDNYEWLHGYDVRFGLADRDRRVRPSAAVLAREAGGSPVG